MFELYTFFNDEAIFHGTFFLVNNGGKVIYVKAGEKNPVTDGEFISFWGSSFYDLMSGLPVSLSNPREYFEALKTRFNGYSWIEERKGAECQTT